MKFYNLHSHTNLGSPYDALGTPEEWVDATIEAGFDAMAITEHGNMNSLAEYVLTVQDRDKKGKKIKPIYGVEFYVIKDVEEWQKEEDIYRTWNKKKGPSPVSYKSLKKTSHLVVWAKNREGLNNLFELVSISHKEPYFYKRPRIDLKLLSSHSSGLIASTACVGGVLGSLYRKLTDQGKTRFEIERSIDHLNEYFKGIFKNGNWYNEIQWNAFPDQHKINFAVLESAKRLGIPVITTTDAHYIKQEYWLHRELYFSMKYMRGDEDEEPKEIAKSIDELGMDLSLKTPDEMLAAIKKYSIGYDYSRYNIQETMENTANIVDAIEPIYPEQKVRMPSFIMDKYTLSPKEEIKRECFLRLKDLGKDNDLYSNRLLEEIDIIDERGFSQYFLTMKEITDTANANFRTGLARGSAAGSLVSFLLGITQIDPLQFDLSFSRFLTRDAIGFPDIDFDVANPAKLKNILIDRWGEEKLAFVSNWNLLKFKNLVKDLGKFFKIPFAEINDMTKIAVKETVSEMMKQDDDIQQAYSPTYSEVMEHSPTGRAFFKKYPFFEQFVEILSGQVRDVSTHAGGIVIGDNLIKDMPLISVNGKYQTPWPEGQNKRMLEPMGFIKFDVLGLSSLQTIENTIGKILEKTGVNNTFENRKAWYEKNLNPMVLNTNDQRVYRTVFHSGKWPGIFQFSKEGAQTFCKNSMPKGITDISIVTSIYRPGPLAANVDKMFLKRKSGQEDEETKITEKIYQNVTKETYGFIVFQEQISELVSKMGSGISEDDGQKIRKLLTKKKGGDFEKLKPYIEKYYKGCEEKGIDKFEAETIWNMISEFAKYGFAKNHAVPYSLISYQCAYLSTYYPKEWIESVLDSDFEQDKWEVIRESVRSGYKVAPLSFEKSGSGWRNEGDILYPPFWVMKGVSKEFAEQISQQQFESIIDVWRYFVSIREKKLLKQFIMCGVFDKFIDGISRRGFVDLIDNFNGQIYSQEHLLESIRLMSLGKNEFSVFEICSAYHQATNILNTSLAFPSEIIGMLASSNIRSAEKIKMDSDGFRKSYCRYYCYVTEIIIKEGWGKLRIADLSGQENEYYVSNYGKIKNMKPYNLYILDLLPERKNSIKIKDIINLSEEMGSVDG